MSQLFQDFGEEATGRKVLIATTAYDNPDASYTFSIQRSREALHKEGIQTAYFLLSGNCHVDDARNVIVQEFLLSDCTELIFIDADVSWEPEQLITLCHYEGLDIVGGVYPFRLQEKKMRGDMPVRMKKGSVVDYKGLIEVEGLPTGFMKIKREVLEVMSNLNDGYWNKKDRRSKVPIVFERTYDAEKEVRWGGDLNFCNQARMLGFKVFAVYDMVLGHAGKQIIKDSLGSALRKQSGTTLAHVVDKIRNKEETPDTYREAWEIMGNPFTAVEDVLAICVHLAREADGPIIETGSGLTTIMMAAANPDQTVWCLEHDPLYAEKLRQMVKQTGLSNIALCVQPIAERSTGDKWYDLRDLAGTLPWRFALGLNDGPPRSVGSRTHFFTAMKGKVDTIICDDADDPGYRKWLEDHAKKYDKQFDFIEPRAAIIRGGKREVSV